MPPYHNPKRKRGDAALCLLAYASGYYSLNTPKARLENRGGLW